MKKENGGHKEVRTKDTAQKEKHKKLALLLGAAALLVLIVAGAAAGLLLGGEEAVYQEAQAAVGTLSVGVTEAGSITVGTTTQSFTLDISEFSGESTFSWDSPGGMGGNMAFGPQMGGDLLTGGQSSSSSTSSGSRQLVVEEVLVKDGQEIENGDPLARLTQESVDSIRSQLAEDVSEAQNVYDQTLTAGQQTRQEADGELQLNILYGSHAGAEYDQSLHTVQTAVTEKEEALAEAREVLAEAQAEMSRKQRLFTEQKQVLANAEYAAETTEREDILYWWLMGVRARTTARETVKTLTTEIEELEEQLKEYDKAVIQAETALELAKKEQETGSVQASIQLAKRSYNTENRQEIYDVAIAQSDFSEAKAQADHEQAEKKLADFDAAIVDRVIYAEYNGLITETAVTAGDTLTRDMALIELNDYDAVTVTVEVAEADMAAAALDSVANVTIAAFPEEVFQGVVTAVEDATIDSNTNQTYYSVTVTVAGTDDLIYQDMTAEVTFITSESAEVLHIPEKAIIREEDKTTVKVRAENGRITTRTVTAGFSDGINTEIKEGLSAGETVVWESKVAGQ